MGNTSQSSPAISIALLAGMVQEAAQRIRPFVTETPAEPVPELVTHQNTELIFKLENLQQTGSFKLRGASNKILSLTPEQAAKGDAKFAARVFPQIYPRPKTARGP